MPEFLPETYRLPVELKVTPPMLCTGATVPKVLSATIPSKLIKVVLLVAARKADSLV